MSNWTAQELAQRLAENPALRVDCNPLTDAAIKVSKYRAQRTTVDGITFDSKREAARYSELKLMERAGAIKDLELQVPYSIDIHGKHICKYVGDFQYYEKMATVEGGWRLILEDCKGFQTPVYKLKRKLVHAIYGVTIRET